MGSVLSRSARQSRQHLVAAEIALRAGRSVLAGQQLEAADQLVDSVSRATNRPAGALAVAFPGSSDCLHLADSHTSSEFDENDGLGCRGQARVPDVISKGDGGF